MDEIPPTAERTGDPVLPELRHLAAFQQVYVARDYTAAAHDLNLDRKGILRMMDRLEQAFRNPLFTEPRRGVLVPSPFADRLFNDLRPLNAAREALHKELEDIRNHGRPVRIGGSPTVFRSSIFRSLFRDLQISGKIRASYVPVPAEEAIKALTGGICDLHIGCVPTTGPRFLSHLLGHLRFRMLERKGASPNTPRSRPWIVTSEEMRVEPLVGEITGYRPLDEARFLHWLDHPEECPAGTLVFAPEIPVSPSHWASVDSSPPAFTGVHLRYLRQHPYEFLPALVNGIKIPFPPHDHA
ncbi:LysR family transcriptional regulator [Luteolibacter sp. SL250]|uniref:LysR family transcriptional regulator n=1 Tax=Luteolibacter sp. SL250 TaxID=2995170 RepID=UPI0022713074|nr:LysR family transcriptional regulator [Luteolibacter sp. SL250]WAC20820.1 LysR family transcriptional regulator [Luteolibacter sp. SL250]